MTRLPTALAACSRWVVTHAHLVLAIYLVLTPLAAWIAVTGFEINSNTERLIRQHGEWRELQDQFEAKFPGYTNLTFVVVSGQSIQHVNDTAHELEAALRARDEYFAEVYAPANDPVLDRHALLYLSPDRLDAVISNLADAQPVLAAVDETPTLGGLLGVLTDSLERAADGEIADPASPGFSTMLELLRGYAGEVNAGRSDPISLRDRFIDSGDTTYNIIFVRGRLSYGDNLPNAHILSNIDAAVAATDIPPGVQVRISGKTPLEHGDIASAMDSAQLAGTVACLFLVVVLVFGVRSLRIILAVYLTMLVGLTFTAAVATFTVGEFNTISIIFLVMFIGLGVDFAIHLCLRYQEDLASQQQVEALVHSNTDIGPALMLCGISSAMGFVAFVPTDYVGLAEMGIISGVGMIIATIVSLTLIPAFLAVCKPPAPVGSILPNTNIALGLQRASRAILVTTLLVSLGAAFFARDVYFDFSNLALRDPDSEAMRTFVELQDEKVITEYAMQFLVADPDEAIALKAKLKGLPTVKDVLVPGDYLPQDQEEKLFLLDDARFLLGSLVEREAVAYEPSSRDDQKAAIAAFERAARHYREAGLDADTSADLEALVNALGAADSNDRTGALESGLVTGILSELDWLSRALTAGELTLDNLPAATRARLQAPSGEFLVTILPAADMSDPQEIRAFTNNVKALLPEATGRGAVELGMGGVVVDAFIKATLLACTGIFLVLLIALRSAIDAVAVFVPLALTALLTFATSVVIGLPLNMANVVVIPLIFGLGVDNGIHVVKRFRDSEGFDGLLASSTPRALLLSTLTTLGTFGALSLSSHQGIYSIGVLLTCALSFQLVLTLIVLPVLLDTIHRRPG